MVWESWVHSWVESYQRLKKWYFKLLCLTLSFIKGKSGTIQGKELRPSLHLGVVAIEKGAFRFPSTAVANYNNLYGFKYSNLIPRIHLQFHGFK